MTASTYFFMVSAIASAYIVFVPPVNDKDNSK